MSERSIQQVIGFNQEIAALAAAGVPIDLGNGPSVRSGTANRIDEHVVGEVNTLLDRVNTALALRVGRGQSLEQAIVDEPQLSPNYRKALLAYVRCDDPRVALEVVSTPASSRRRFARGIGQALLYPIIILLIAYLGCLYLVTVTFPEIEAIYVQMEQTPPALVTFLNDSREWLLIWGIAVPLLVLLMVFWWRRRGSRLSWSWLPGSSKYYRSMQNAHLATQLAKMLESGCSLPDSLATLFPETSPPPAFKTNASYEADGSKADGIESNGTKAAGDVSVSVSNPAALHQLPPLVRWAIEADPVDEPLSKLLRFVAATYQQMAERQEKLWRVIAPTICGLVLGGVVVLGYGLSLFLPVIQLLKDLAAPGSGIGGV